jgi:hypothetical protein
MLFSLAFLQGSIGRSEARVWLLSLGIDVETLDRLTACLQNMRAALWRAKE